MAFNTTIENEFVVGNLRLFFGTYTNDSSSTGGPISFPNTSTIHHVQLQPKGSSVSANQPVVNETMPLAEADDGDATGVQVDVTVVTSANEVGTFFAIGQ